MSRCAVVFTSATLAALALGVAHADVTVKERIAVEGQGLMAMANMSGTATTAISGKRARTESDLQMESRLVRMFAHGAGQNTEIVRLDEDKVFEIDPKKRTYKEESLAVRRARLQQAAEQAKQQQDKQPAPTGMDESDCEWSEPTTDVKHTGAKAQIAGFDAEQVSIVAKQSCKSRKTGAVCDIALLLDEWIAPGFTLSDEVTKYRMAYAEQMGLTSGGRDVTERAQAMFGRYKGAWQQIADKMKDVKGYPVKTSFSLGLGGAQCQNGGGSSSQTSDSGSGSSSSQNPSALASQIAGSLFKKKKPAPAPETAPTPSAAAASGLYVPLSISSELLAVSKDSLPADTFEVPAGFKKVAD
jgi:hypothetical protein